MGDVTAVWETLVSGALVGTGRQSPVLPDADGALGAVLTAEQRAKASESEAALLGAAAVVSLYLRAGRRPEATEAAWEPCDTDDLPVCGPRAEHYLGIVLGSGGDYRALLPEWLEATARSGRRISERCLPEVLEAGRRDRSLRDPIQRVLGKRGRWLAAKNPEWKYVSEIEADLFASGDPGAAEAAWETGNRATRVELLQQARRADPERARVWVTKSWSQERAEERAAFLGTFSVNLEPADEPFLEQALDDRSGEVRATAADLLSRLPASQLAKRIQERADVAVRIRREAAAPGGMLARLTSLVGGQREAAGRVIVEITPPTEIDKAMQRDGIAPKSQVYGMGDRAHCLMQIVAGTPIGFWQSLGATPEEWIAAVAESEWRDAMLLGWARAALRHDDAGWAEALVTFWMAHPKRDSLPGDLRTLVGTVSPTLLERLILEALRRDRGGPLTGAHPALPLLQAHTTPWSPELATAVIGRFRQRQTEMAQRQYDWQSIQILKEAGRLVPIELADELCAGWSLEKPDQGDGAAVTNYHTNYLREAAERFVTTVQFRRDMLKEVCA